MLEVILKRFEQPDEIRTFEKGRFEVVRLGGMTIGRATYEPGWKWSEHVGRAARSMRRISKMSRCPGAAGGPQCREESVTAKKLQVPVLLQEKNNSAPICLSPLHLLINSSFGRLVALIPASRNARGQ